MSDPASTANPSSAGPAERLLQLGGRLLAILLEGGHTRAELFSLELALERGRLLRLLLLVATLIATGVLGSIFLSSLIIIYFWDSYRLLAASAVAAFYILAALVAGLALLRQLRLARQPFAQSVATLRRDLDTLRDNLQQTPAHDPDSADDIGPRYRDM
jgi:uncharacterized membrane protein YqjE